MVYRIILFWGVIMYVGPYQRLKKQQKEDSIVEKNIKKEKNSSLISSSKNTYTSVQIIDELINKFFKNVSDEKFSFVIYTNLIGKKCSDKIMDIVLSKFDFIKIDISKISLYNSTILFFLKRIIKNLPLVSNSDKKILWDRILLFAKSLDMKINDIKSPIPSNIVYDDIEYDDPIEYIKNEIIEVIRAYNITNTINIYLENLDANDYSLFKKIYLFISKIFFNISQFKFIGQLYKLEIIKDLSIKYPGNNNFNELIFFTLRNNSIYLISNENIVDDY